MVFHDSKKDPLAVLFITFSLLSIPYNVAGAIKARPANPLANCTLQSIHVRPYPDGTKSGVQQEIWSCIDIEDIEEADEEETSTRRLRKRGIAGIRCSDWDYDGQVTDPSELLDALERLGKGDLWTDPCPQPNEVARFTKGDWSFTAENRDISVRCNRLVTMKNFMQEIFSNCEEDSIYGGGYGNDDVHPQVYSLWPTALVPEEDTDKEDTDEEDTDEEKDNDQSDNEPSQTTGGESPSETPNRASENLPSNNTSTTEEESSPTAAIAGGVVGGLAAIGLIAFLIIFYRNNTQKNSSKHINAAELENGSPVYIPTRKLSAQLIYTGAPKYPHHPQVVPQEYPSELDSHPIHEPLTTGQSKERVKNHQQEYYPPNTGNNEQYSPPG